MYYIMFVVYFPGDSVSSLNKSAIIHRYLHAIATAKTTNTGKVQLPLDGCRDLFRMVFTVVRHVRTLLMLVSISNKLCNVARLANAN